MGVVTVTATSSIEDAVTITDGTGAAATTSTGTTAVIVIDGAFAGFAFVTHCPGDARMQRGGRVAPSRRGRFSRHRHEEAASSGRSSAQPHLDGDTDQVRMVLGAEFLLEQRRGVGNGFV